MKVFVQGDRDARDSEKAAQAIAAEFCRRSVHVNLGAYGRLVRIFLEAGCPATCYGHRERGEVPGEVPFRDCLALSKLLLSKEGGGSRELAWGIRLGILMATSDAFLFFAGREGTVAHLLPVLAFASKRWQEKPHKIALVGWNQEQISALVKLMGPMPNGVRFFGPDPTPATVVDFLTS